jgi:hypothetical protein
MANVVKRARRGLRHDIDRRRAHRVDEIRRRHVGVGRDIGLRVDDGRDDRRVIVVGVDLDLRAEAGVRGRRLRDEQHDQLQPHPPPLEP